MKFYEVGGAVRDQLMGINSKDVDFAVEAESFESMKEELHKLGFIIFNSIPEYFTIRAHVPPHSPLLKRTKVADFVLCRKDGPTKDGRRPEYVEPGTILDDLARRDFTMNAIAKDPETGELIDPYNGAEDIKHAILKFVRDPVERISEDGLRVLRGFRFVVTRALTMEPATEAAMNSGLAVSMLRSVSTERIREELEKMFSYSTRLSLRCLGGMSSSLVDAIFRDSLRLMPTMRQG